MRRPAPWFVRTVPFAELEATLNEGAALGYELEQMEEADAGPFSSEPRMLVVMKWEDHAAQALDDAGICPHCGGVMEGFGDDIEEDDDAVDVIQPGAPTVEEH